jgi:hypothetical protein
MSSTDRKPLQAPLPSSVLDSVPPTVRSPMPTLPDGVPAELWEDAVESERHLTLPLPVPEIWP